MIAIALPTAPLIGPEVNNVLVYGIAAGTAVMSVLMLLWGRTVIGRIMLAAAGGYVAWLYGGGLAQAVNLNPLIGRIALGVVAVAALLLLARLIWAIAAAAFFELVAVAGMICHFVMSMPDQKWPVFADAPTFLDWPPAAWTYAMGCFQIAWTANPVTILLVTIPAAMLPGLIAILKPRASTVFTTSLIGGATLAGTLWFIAVQIRPTIWPESWMNMLIPAGVAIVLTIIGLVYQGHGELAAIAKQEKKGKDAKADNAKPTDAKSAGETSRKK